MRRLCHVWATASSKTQWMIFPWARNRTSRAEKLFSAMWQTSNTCILAYASSPGNITYEINICIPKDVLRSGLREEQNAVGDIKDEIWCSFMWELIVILLFVKMKKHAEKLSKIVGNETKFWGECPQGPRRVQLNLSSPTTKAKDEGHTRMQSLHVHRNARKKDRAACTKRHTWILRRHFIS